MTWAVIETRPCYFLRRVRTGNDAHQLDRPTDRGPGGFKLKAEQNRASGDPPDEITDEGSFSTTEIELT